MATTSVSIQTKSIWVVNAECLDEASTWNFDNEEMATRFSKIAQEWWSARCPECENKDSTNLDCHDFGEGGITVIIWCAWSDCKFTKKIAL